MIDNPPKGPEGTIRPEGCTTNEFIMEISMMFM